ncbi:DUF6542 domain-containing protein [Streptomyces sp. MspMP-M5]|uniref:DUF6542 domain-containing protein n=1 Tax=unclassified Streptomyces TaxID=2593676 RepID=UPI00036AC9DF|nr:DUF6542 domain-containing protein [Streptomyces sp. MspMP-M5]
MEQHVEQPQARTSPHGRPRSGGPDTDTRLPRPAEAMAADPDDAFLSAMRASGYASVPSGTEVTARGYAPGPAEYGAPAYQAAAPPAMAAGEWMPRPAAGPPADGEEVAAVYRAGPRRPPAPAPVAGLLRRMPAAKLTGLGCGLLATAALLAFGFLDRWLLDGAQGAYGAFFLLVGVAAGAWVRPLDLVAAPVALPIAFAVGTLPVQHGPTGFPGLLVGVFTVLALNAGWLYGGTLLCGLLVVVRKALLIAGRRASRPVSRQRRPGPGPRAGAPRPGGSARRGPEHSRGGGRPRRVARL